MGRPTRGVKRLFPLMSIAAIVLIIGVIVALNQPQLPALALPVIIAVVLHNLLGLASGYVVPKALGFDSTICQTIAIEVGMQNSGLAVALAIKYFIFRPPQRYRAPSSVSGTTFQVLRWPVFGPGPVARDTTVVLHNRDAAPLYAPQYSYQYEAPYRLIRAGSLRYSFCLHFRCPIR